MIFVAWASSQAQSLDQQERCARQALEAFQGYLDRPGFFSDYEEHYNTKLGKCLVFVRGQERIDSRPLKDRYPLINDWITFAYLWDVNEAHAYAEFWAQGRVVTACGLKPSLRVTRECKSREEFDAFVASYMEQ
jgi:hypothetical protein